MNLKKKHDSEIIARVSLYGGRDEGDLMRDMDPDGDIVQHQVNRTQRMTDRLFRDGALTDDQYVAATKLRDTWEAGTLGGFPVARDAGQPLGSGGGRNQHEDAYRRYRAAMCRLGGGPRLVVQGVVLWDQSPKLYGGRGPVLLIDGLDMLVKFYDGR